MNYLPNVAHDSSWKWTVGSEFHSQIVLFISGQQHVFGYFCTVPFVVILYLIFFCVSLNEGSRHFMENIINASRAFRLEKAQINSRHLDRKSEKVNDQKQLTSQGR